MKTKKSLLRIISVALILLISSTVFGQFSQVGNILSTAVDGSTKDAEKILNAYISPFANGTGASLSGGWYNSAKPHKLGGFDVTITANLVIIPSSDKTFDPNKLGLGDPANGLNVTIDGNESPTIAGKKETGALVEYTQNIDGVDVPFTRFNLPKGSNMSYSFMPMVQAGVGLMKGTEIIIRYSPELNYGSSGKLGLWGAGIKHDVKQWIPALNKLPILNISVHGGYTKLSSTNGLNFQPEFYEPIIGESNVSNFFPEMYDNQELIMDISNTTANLLVSANLPVICVYGGVGFSASNSNVMFKGNYPMVALQGNTFVVDESTAVKNPIDMTIKSNDVRLNAGFRIKMAVVTLHFDYTYANYSIATAGLGVSLR